jgi:predicted nuclease with TOPRIM domain
MTLFVILQILFDAALVAAMLFGFSYIWQKVQHRREDDEVLRNVELQELRAGLEELLVTVRQVGGEVSERLQDKVKEAEKTLSQLESILDELKPDLEEIQALSRDVASEKEHLEAKRVSLKSSRRPAMPLPMLEEDLSLGGEDDEEDGESSRTEDSLVSSTAVGFPSSAVKEIYRLADNQLNVGEIARQTHLTRGEIQLILNLRSNRFTTPN